MKGTKREKNIDLMKCFFVLGMILSHCFDILAKNLIITSCITFYFNLISFSGFMFIYGYNIYNSYIIKSNSAKKQLLGILKIIISFWISGILYDFFILNNHDFNNYLNIIFLLKLPPFSEFLITFAIIGIFVLFFKKYIKIICSKNIFIIISIIISLLFSMIPAISVFIPWLNLFIKTYSVSFPVIPYLNLFFLGVYFAKNKPKSNVYCFVILILLYIIFLFLLINGYATRFPISLPYIFGSYLFIYIYYFVSKKMYENSRYTRVLDKINIIGKNSLQCLLISNIILFMSYHIYGDHSLLMTLICYIFIMTICYFHSLLVSKKRNM